MWIATTALLLLALTGVAYVLRTALVGALRERGYDGQRLHAILSANWLRILREVFAV